MSAALTALTTAHRVVNRIHDYTTVARTATEPTAAACFTANLKVMLRIGNNTNSGTASLQNHTHLTTGHFNDSILVVARHELCISTSATHHLGALARTQLNVVNQCAERNFSKSQSVSNFWSNTFTRHDSLTNF